MKYKFIPNFNVVENISPGVFSIKDFSSEVGVYSATPEFVKKNCGDLAKLILSKIPCAYYEEADFLGLYPNCDIRIHRLYPSDIPAYPGWHCDGEYRETYFSQPDLNRIKVSKNIVCTLSTYEDGVSNTEFLDQIFDFESIEEPDFILWQQVNRELKKLRSKKIYQSKDGELIQFDNWTLHRAIPAKIRGWRLFFRMSMWHKKNLGEGGMISKQEQVYKYYSDNGW